MVNTKLASIGITSPKTLEKKSGTKNYSGYSLEEYAKLGDYKVVQSGGFLNSISPPTPLGFVKIQGIEINDVHNSWLTKGFFCTNGNKFSIKAFSSKEETASWISCLQAGPMMIENNKFVLDTRKNTYFITGQKHRQSFLCEKSETELVMGISENLTLSELGRALTGDESLGFSCKNAVALNPKSISGMYLNSEPDKSIGNIDVPLFTAIVVK